MFFILYQIYPIPKEHTKDINDTYTFKYTKSGTKGTYNMNNNKKVGTQQQTRLLQQTSDLLNLDFTRIRNNYAGYPICLIDYIEKDIEEKTIEIRFDKEETTLTCIFNSDEICNRVYLLPDNKEYITKLITTLTEIYDYDFIKTRWIAPNHYIKVKEADKPANNAGNVYLVFHC